METLEQLRFRKIEAMQQSLRRIRQILNIGVQEFSDIVGLSRQSINNLENNKVKMSPTQYLAICTVIDHLVESQPELFPIICTILNSYDTMHDSELYEDIPENSFVNNWFNCFPNDSKITVPISDIPTDLIRNYKVFLDDTALCEMNKGQALVLADRFAEASKRFIVPLIAIEMLQRRLFNNGITSEGQIVKTMNEASRLAINNLNILQAKGIVDIRGDKNDFSIASTIASVFVKFKSIYRLALITQNRKLATLILNYNNDKSGGFPIMVLRFAENQSLQKWDEIEDNQSNMKSEIVYDNTDSEPDFAEYETNQYTDISSWGMID